MLTECLCLCDHKRNAVVNMAKNDNLELAVQGLIMELGVALTAQHGTRSRRINGPSPTVPQDADLEDRLLALVMTDPIARQQIGLKEKGQDDAERRLRLRTMAVLACRLLREPVRSHVDMAEMAVAVMDTRQNPGAALLSARHGIGQMAMDGLLRVVPAGPYLWNVGLMPLGKAVQWLAGGKSSLGVLTPQRLAARKSDPEDQSDIAAPTPLPAKTIRNRLAERVVGLDGQLDIVSGRLALHMERARLLAAGKETGTPNECVLVLGESGTGKSWLCQQAGWATGLPHAACNAAEMSASGYVGLSADDGLRELIIAAKGRIETARYGVMTYDEITKRAGSMNESPVNSTAVFNELLRIVQGQLTQVGGKRSSSYEPVFWLDTRGTFFFLSGHAPGLDRLIERRQGRKTIGFGTGGSKGGNRGLLLDALEDFGLTPELLNRLTAVLAIPPPRLCDLIRAATADNGVIAGYNRLLTPGGCRLRFDAKAVQEMAACCLSSRLYYRGLASIVSALAADAVMQGGRTITVKPSDIQRAVERLDEAANDLLAHARLAQTDWPCEPTVDGITGGAVISM